ncbi:MAG: DUF502 domain-containing protein [Planctomycetes bacterium]|nr:DUF502 domain-containing protein [Planctomycetota bacterium]
MKRLTAIFAQGLIAMLPLAVTVLLLYWFASAAEQTLGAGIRMILPEPWYVRGMGIAAGLALTFMLGLLVNTWGMPQLIRLGEKVIGRIPLVKTVYGATRDLLGFFTSVRKHGAVSSVVMVSLGATGVRVVGLLTRERFDGLPAGIGSEADVAVYVPFGYQIGGVTMIVPRERVRPIDMSLEDAMRFVITAGVRSTAGVPDASAPKGRLEIAGLHADESVARRSLRSRSAVELQTLAPKG